MGQYQLIERGYSDKASISTIIMAGMVDPVSKLLKTRRAKPTLCIASDQYSSLVLFGLISFDVTIPYSTHSVCNLEIEGFINGHDSIDRHAGSVAMSNRL